MTDKININWESGLLLPANYPISLEINILIGVKKELGNKSCCRRLYEELENPNLQSKCGLQTNWA